MSETNIIERRRVKLGLSYAGLADAMGVSESTARSWAKGANMPHRTRWGRLSVVLRITVEALAKDFAA